ncbi:Predicted membrane protein [Phaffia rhodozyma]|uniref:Predicted membrane protein n=1 Tax=Phaffia rhodozyma TaxID=264483 RepID=A0A0F7SQ48_PHARH|nr:Predicted membrane protein [Phaffia rhodozyma]
MGFKDTFLPTTLSATQASISVLLILAYGFYARKRNWITEEAEKNISFLGTHIFLPALLFSEIGPLASIQNLKHYWSIPVVAITFQLLSLAISLTLSKLKVVPPHVVPAFIFNNVTSLPLLLIESLGSAGALKSLASGGDSSDEIVAKARVYFLINALVGNLTRFALGPALMSSSDPLPTDWSFSESPFSTVVQKVQDALPTSSPSRRGSSDEQTSLLPSRETVKENAFTMKDNIQSVMNPPLLGGLAAVTLGTVEPIRNVVFKGGAGGWVKPLTDSISKLGGLFTALQMFILGAHLCSKPSTKYAPWVLNGDPVLAFVLCLCPVGPPALTLASIAQMSDIDEDAEGQIARIILVSYAVTPLISIAVSAAVWICSMKY